MENNLFRRAGRSEIDLTPSDLFSVTGLLDYMARTSGRDYDVRDSLDVHCNRFIIVGVSIAYATAIGMLTYLLSK